MSVVVTDHFKERVNQRIGDVDPVELAERLFWAIENDRRDVARFLGRQNFNKGRRVFEFKTPDGRTFGAVLNTRTMTAITVVCEGYEVRRFRNRTVRVGG